MPVPYVKQNAPQQEHVYTVGHSQVGIVVRCVIGVSAFLVNLGTSGALAGM